MATGIYLGARGLKLDEFRKMIDTYHSDPKIQKFVEGGEITFPGLIQVPYEGSKAVLMGFQANIDKIKHKHPGKEPSRLLEEVLDHHIVNMSNYIANTNKKHETEEERDYLALPVDSSLGGHDARLYDMLIKSDAEEWGKSKANFTMLGFSDNGLDKTTFNEFAQLYISREKVREFEGIRREYELIKEGLLDMQERVIALRLGEAKLLMDFEKKVYDLGQKLQE